LNVFHVSKCKAWVVTGLKYTEPENEVLCVDMHFCEVVIIIELCVLDNTLQKLVGPIFASTLVVCRVGKAFAVQDRRDLSNVNIFSNK